MLEAGCGHAIHANDGREKKRKEKSRKRKAEKRNARLSGRQTGADLRV